MPTGTRPQALHCLRQFEALSLLEEKLKVSIWEADRILTRAEKAGCATTLGRPYYKVQARTWQDGILRFSVEYLVPDP